MFGRGGTYTKNDVDNCRIAVAMTSSVLRKRGVAFITVIGIFSRNSIICYPQYIVARRLPSKVTWLRFRAYAEKWRQRTSTRHEYTTDRRPSVDWRPTDIAVWRFPATSHGVHRSRYCQLSYAPAVFVSTKNVIFISAQVPIVFPTKTSKKVRFSFPPNLLRLLIRSLRTPNL